MARIVDEAQNVVGEKIKKYRMERKLSQKDLSEKLEVYAIYICRGSISRIESHERTVTDFELRAMAKVLSVSIEELYEEKTI
ncbi:helix-turn-helix domain-containing protein [Parablautia muri]|uniref:XRE family transcriptional regulator n=1 Tax=Parablautia muri TaxID=2320879 RepID=A0A9X5GS92_9FIRM|nr:helix-turn-helix transcriptional regulator [Parablautia muri]NBJ92725.1 XRE family transcriptional regulator [Parablautia muri]